MKERLPLAHVKPAPAAPDSPPCPMAPTHILRPLNARTFARPNHRIGRSITIQVDLCRPAKHDTLNGFDFFSSPIHTKSNRHASWVHGVANNSNREPWEEKPTLLLWGAMTYAEYSSHLLAPVLRQAPAPSY
jgi:hypothetical protein